MPTSMGKELEALPNFAKWSDAICAEENVTYIFDGPGLSKSMEERLQKMKAERR